jgi:hypothetical protein
MGLAQLAGKNGNLMSKDRLQVATVVMALNSFFFAWRANKRNSVV